MKSEDYIVIQGWMLDLDLTDKQRQLYAMIWGFSRDGRSRMRATARYIAEWVGCQERHVKRMVRQLEEKGLICHEVVRTMKSTYTEFWAVSPEEATRQELTDKIAWRGRALQDPTGRALEDTTGRALQDPTDKVYKYTNSRNKKNSCCKNSARGAQTTTTTGFLFENENLVLPYEEDYFSKAWAMLLQQPEWKDKTPAALALTLQELASVADPAIATYCVNLAIKRGWSDIVGAQKIYEADEDKVLEFARQLNARKEGGKK